MTLAAFLVGMVGPLAARLLAALGLSLVTMTGLVSAVAALKGQMLANLGGLPGDGLLLGGLLGVWQCLGMILGCIAFRVTWSSTKGFIGLAKAGA
jgi:Protein of unknown function (DUF2523)